MKKSLCASALLLAAGTALAIEVGPFVDPSKEHRPETWFHLIGGNVSKGGLAADLDAVASAGISGIQLFHGQFGGPWPGVSPQIPCLSADWDDLVRFAADGCAARGKRRPAFASTTRIPCFSHRRSSTPLASENASGLPPVSDPHIFSSAHASVCKRHRPTPRATSNDAMPQMPANCYCRLIAPRFSLSTSPCLSRS